MLSREAVRPPIIPPAASAPAVRLPAALRGAAVALVLLLAAACTNDSNDTAAVDADATRTITDARGEDVVVPASPKRVVTLSEPTLDAVLTLGVTPVGAAAARGQTTAVPAYLADQTEGVEVVGALGQPDLERVLGLEPDLILIDGTASGDQSLIRRLEGVAPTVWVGDAGNADWQDSLQVVAEALDRVDEADAVVATYDERVREVSAELRDDVGTISVVRWGLASGSYLPVDTFPGAIVADVGLARPPAQAASGTEHSQPVSLENIEDLDADWMFFGTLGGAAGAGSAADGGGAVGEQESADVLSAALELGVGLEDLEVHRAGHIVPVDGSVWGSAGGASAALALLEDLAESLTR